MQSRTTVLAAMLTFLALPFVVVATAAVAFHVENRVNGTIVSSGVTREYLLYVPARYDRSAPTPLVVSMHGAAGWPAQQMRTSQWNRIADTNGFIVVYPSGITGEGPTIWHVERGGALATDVRFIADLIDTLSATYNIDPSRIYANGLSNGGGMSFALSCTLSDRIAAVGLVGAALTLPWSWCTDERAVPMIAFHGTADPDIPYRGGFSGLSPERFPSIPGWAALWARRNHCALEPVESDVTSDVSRQSYTRCAGDADVLLYTVKEGGHTWPGGTPLPEWFVGTTSQDIDASSVMWEFFRKHPLRAPRAPALTR